MCDKRYSLRLSHTMTLEPSLMLCYELLCFVAMVPRLLLLGLHRGICPHARLRYVVVLIVRCGGQQIVVGCRTIQHARFLSWLQSTLDRHSFDARGPPPVWVCGTELSGRLRCHISVLGGV